jgi:hypothetical protein
LNEDIVVREETERKKDQSKPENSNSRIGNGPYRLFLKEGVGNFFKV